MVRLLITVLLDESLRLFLEPEELQLFLIPFSHSLTFYKFLLFLLLAFPSYFRHTDVAPKGSEGMFETFCLSAIHAHGVFTLLSPSTPSFLYFPLEEMLPISMMVTGYVYLAGNIYIPH